MRPTDRTSPEAAFTLAELALALALVGLIAALAVPRLGGALDRLRVRSAAAEARAAFAVARQGAIARGHTTAVGIDSAAGALVVHADSDTLWHRRPGVEYGVALSATRDSMAYSPIGLGVGGANLRLLLRRGAAAETLWVSREGRVRH